MVSTNSSPPTIFCLHLHQKHLLIVIYVKLYEGQLGSFKGDSPLEEVTPDLTLTLDTSLLIYSGHLTAPTLAEPSWLHVSEDHSLILDTLCPVASAMTLPWFSPTCQLLLLPVLLVLLHPTSIASEVCPGPFSFPMLFR